MDKANQLNNLFNRFDSPISFSPQTSTSGLPLSSSSLSLPSQVNNHSQRTLPPTTIIIAHVQSELRKICPSRTAGPDGVSSRLLQACELELGEPLQRIFNMGLEQRSVSRQWKTSCIVLVPKKPQPSALNDFRPVALKSHVMKTMERLLIQYLRPQTKHALAPLQFAYQEKVGVEDTFTFLLHKSLSHLGRDSGAVRITFLDFSSAFNTIQPRILRHKLTEMGVDT